MLLASPALLSTPVSTLANKWRMLCTISGLGGSADTTSAPDPVGHITSGPRSAPEPGQRVASSTALGKGAAADPRRRDAPAAAVHLQNPTLSAPPHLSLALKAALLTGSYNALARLKYLLYLQRAASSARNSATLSKKASQASGSEEERTRAVSWSCGHPPAVSEEGSREYQLAGGSPAEAGSDHHEGRAPEAAGPFRQEGGLKAGMAIHAPCGSLDALAGEAVGLGDAVFRARYPGYAAWLAA